MFYICCEKCGSIPFPNIFIIFIIQCSLHYIISPHARIGKSVMGDPAPYPICPA